MQLSKTYNLVMHKHLPYLMLQAILSYMLGCVQCAQQYQRSRFCCKGIKQSMEISLLMLWSLKEDNKLKNMLSMCGNVFTKMVPVQFKVMLPQPSPKKQGRKLKKRKYIMLHGNTGNTGSKIVKSYLQFFEMLEAFNYKARTIVVIITRAKMPSWAHIIYIHTSHTHCSVLMK